MGDRADFGGMEMMGRSACDEPFAGCGDGRWLGRERDGDGLQVEPSSVRWPGRVGAVGVALLVVLVGWPALVFIDFALGLLLAFAI